MSNWLVIILLGQKFSSYNFKQVEKLSSCFTDFEQVENLRVNS